MKRSAKQKQTVKAPPAGKTAGQAFERLVTVIDQLRRNCPWDRKQTMESLRHLTVEETYELGEAILDNDASGIGEEVGDLLMHMVFYAKLGSEAGTFDVISSLNGVCGKLIRRHPHVYGNVRANTAAQVKRNWEKIKLGEGKKSVLDGVPLSLPAMVKSMRIQEKARQVGFDWEEKQQVWDKVLEEMNEFLEAARSENRQAMESEFGDLLFSLVNYARFADINPENALEKTNMKFIRRFRKMEAEAKSHGAALHDLTLVELEKLWQSSKP